MKWFDALLKKQQYHPCFCLRQEGVSMVIFDQNSQKITAHEFITADLNDDEEVQLLLLELSNRYDLAGKKCQLVLMPGQYQLLMTERLEVPMEEMAQALKWRIKGLLDYPIDDVSISVCEIPPHGISGQKKAVFLAATQQSWLEKKIDQFGRAYMSISNVTIADMAIRNIISDKYDNGQPLACLYIDTLVSKIIIYNKHNLFLIRQLSHNINLNDKGAMSSALDNILLEVQRSYDYCVSELKLNSPSKLIVSPRVVSHKELYDYLQTNLSTPVEAIDLIPYLQVEESLSLERQSQLLLPIGCGLGMSQEDIQEESYDTAN